MNIYIKLENELIETVEKITDVDYEKQGDMLSADELTSMLKDLIYEISKRDEKLEDLKEEMNECYEPKRIDPYYEYGVNERYFV